jgi:hypothetical protein
MRIPPAADAGFAGDDSWKDLLPGAKIQLALSDSHHHLATHDLAFHMRIGVVLADIVAVLRYRFMGSELFQPDVIIVMQPGFIIIIYEYRRGYMHRVYFSSFRHKLHIFSRLYLYSQTNSATVPACPQSSFLSGAPHCESSFVSFGEGVARFC